MDQRIIKLSDMLTSYSCDLQRGDRVLIDYEGEASRPLVCQLIKDCYKLGAKPYVTSRDSRLPRAAEMVLFPVPINPIRNIFNVLSSL